LKTLASKIGVSGSIFRRPRCLEDDEIVPRRDLSSSRPLNTASSIDLDQRQLRARCR
jgi:hypothetical protein